MRHDVSDGFRFPCHESDDGKCFNFICKFSGCRFNTSDSRSCLEAPQFCPAFQFCAACINRDCSYYVPYVEDDPDEF